VAFFRKLTMGKHNWPESIDFDRSGNLYFSDHREKALFSIRRNPDGALADTDEMLLYGFDHASGVSIDRENNILYLGIQIKKAGAILCIPLELFDEQTNIRYPSFRWDRLKDLSLQPEEIDLNRGKGKRGSPKPNGVIFDKGTNSVFYTNSNLEGAALCFNGFVGNTSDPERKKFFTPNGIDVDPTAEGVLVISLARKKRILRLDWRNKTSLESPRIGKMLDGLLCLENGDVLVASFYSKAIFHLRWNGRGYEKPTVIQNKLDCATDVALGQSANGSGESLFVTATKGFFRSYWEGGAIIEIPNIQALIYSK
jgi:hypothetical protein